MTRAGAADSGTGIGSESLSRVDPRGRGGFEERSPDMPLHEG